MVQFLSGPQAAEYIKDGDSIALLGNGGAVLEPRMVYRCIEERFLATGSPRDLSLSHSTGIGDKAVEGMSRFAHEGMVKRVIGGHWGWSPPDAAAGGRRAPLSLRAPCRSRKRR